MLFAGRSLLGRAATRLAALPCPPHYGRHRLARFSRKGYVAPSAGLAHPGLRLGENVFVGDRVVVYAEGESGPVELGDRVHLNEGTFIQTGAGGSVSIAADTHVQARCQLAAYVAPIVIGRGVQIAPNCSLYSYDHGKEPGVPMRDQPLYSKGPIRIGDDAWLGVGVTVLAGVSIGRGAVIGAGAVVTSDVPDRAVAVGVPARVVKTRDD